MTFSFAQFKTSLADRFPYPTSHDILKSFAVIIMIIDHIGTYFYPDDNWWRAIGRIGFPVWFFLIGHTSSRQIGTKLLSSAIILVLANLLFGMLIMPLNALWSIIVIRLVLDKITKLVGHSETRLFILILLLTLLDPFLNFLWEYGSLAIIFALCGHYQRNGFGGKRLLPALIGLIAFLFFTYSQQELFNLTTAPLVFMVAGTFLTMLALFFYLPRKGPALHTNNQLITIPLMFCGRYTLEIYVVHLLIFKLAYFLIRGCAPSICLLH